MTDSQDIASVIVSVNGSTGKDRHYDANQICKRLGISNYMTAISGLNLGLEKVMYLGNDGEKFALTQNGVRRLIDGVPEREKLDVKILRHFGYDTENVNAKSKHAAEKAALEKPLEKNSIVGFLRAVYPDRKIHTNWVVPTTERSFDIYIPSNNGKDSIAIICNADRSEPLQLTPEEVQTAFNLKATTQKNLQWLLFKDYDIRRPNLSFFTLLSQINNILYGPLDVETRKPRKPRKPKSEEGVKEGSKKDKSKKDKPKKESSKKESSKKDKPKKRQDKKRQVKK